MAEEKWTCMIDKDLRPAYYDSFHCLMSDCRMSCCKNWRITFDKNDYQKLKKSARVSAELAKRMEHGLHRLKEKDALMGHYAQMHLDDRGHCPLLAESGLCALQLEAGEKALPHVCYTYPRRETSRISGYLERSLSPSCEAVLYQLWNLPEGVDFRSDPLPKEKWSKLTETETSYLTPYFQEIRGLCIAMLQDRSIPLHHRILLMGLRLQALMDENVDIPRWLAGTEALLTAEKPSLQKLFEVDDAALRLNMGNNIQMLLRKDKQGASGETEKILLETLGVNFGESKVEVSEMREKEGVEFQIHQKLSFETSKYLEMKAEFEQRFAQQEYFFENLAVSIFFYLGYPNVSSAEALWKSYATFCQIWSFYRFLSVLSVRTQLPPMADEPNEELPAPGSQGALFQLLAGGSRSLIHNQKYTEQLIAKLFKNESATLAHMAILLGG